MEISTFEAAALCYCHHKDQEFSGDLLVIDLDNGTVGLCTCDRGEPKKVTEEPVMVGDTPCGMLLSGLNLPREQLFAQKDTLNRSMQDYYHSYKALDGVALQVGTAQVTCKQMDDRMQPIEKALAARLESILDTLGPQREDALQIILMGRAAGLLPLEYAARQGVGSQPLLPDRRFAQFSFAPEEIVPRGMALAEQRHTLPWQCSLVLWGAEGGKIRVPLTEKGKRVEDLKTPEYVKSVLVGGKDGITLELNGLSVHHDLPFGLGAQECDLVDVGIGESGQQPMLMLRRSRIPTKIYSIPLNEP